jgi:hypothetical protein
MCRSKEQVAKIIPNSGRAHLTFQTDEPGILILFYYAHPKVPFL